LDYICNPVGSGKQREPFAVHVAMLIGWIGIGRLAAFGLLTLHFGLLDGSKEQL
jgi:hypothetical protein